MDYAVPDESELEEVFEGVHIAELTIGTEANINYVVLEPGAEVPQHSHENEQHGFVHDGTLTVTFENRKNIEISAGEAYVMESNEVHGVVNNGSERVTAIDIFSPPRRVLSDE